MINSTSHQAWLFYSPLALQAALLKDDLLDPVDQLLEDPDLLKLFQQCLAARSPASARTGRPGMAPAAKCLTEANQQRMRDSYQKLVGLTRGVVRQASAVVQRWGKGRLKVVGKFLRVEAQIGQLRHFLPLVEKVMTQTKERVWGGNCHVEGKVLSLFEAHTEVIRKGKAHKPNEFGRLVRIDEVENGIVSGYQVLPGNPADTTAWMPALEQHQARFGRMPEMATGDRGFFSAKNQRAAQKLGVKKVALPASAALACRL
jgi:transposase, IS5 family